MECTVPYVRNLRTNQRCDNKSWRQKVCGRKAQTKLQQDQPAHIWTHKVEKPLGQTPKVTNSQDRDCNHCRVPETVNHYLFECEKYVQARKKLGNQVEEILQRQDITCGDITVGVLTGEIENISTAAKEELISNIWEFIRATKRL